MHKIEDIEKRRSVRTFIKKEITQEVTKKIESLLGECKKIDKPFGHIIDFSILSLNENEKIGTYGIIKNPAMYIGGACINNEEALIDLGYAFESLILSLTHEEIGTCWMAGTFKRQQVKDLMNLGPLEILPVIIPLGYFEDQRRFETVFRKIVKADNRLERESICFYENFNQPLSESGIDHLDKAVEMVRIGPSASNKQPWRLLINEAYSACHFYGAYHVNYSKKLGFNVQSIDMGISMYHFEFTMKSFGIKGHWSFEAPDTNTPDDSYQYVASYNFGDNA